jgi:hypothetical protein
MTDLLPARKISVLRPGTPELLTEDATAWLQERRGERRPLQDHGDGLARPRHARMTRILVIQNQAELQRTLRASLRARLCDVMAARTGREALALAASRLPDAIILDLSLPDAKASRSSSSCAADTGCRSSCCPAGPALATRSARSMPAPTIT